MPKRLLRGVIDFGDNRISTENLEVNYRRLFHSRYDFANPDERKIWDFVVGYHQNYGEVPLASIVREQHEKMNELTVVEKVDDIAYAAVHTRVHFESLLTELKTEQKKGEYHVLYSDCEEIVTKGKVVGKRKWHGVADAEEWRTKRLAEIEANYAEPLEDEPTPLHGPFLAPTPFPLDVFPPRIEAYCRAVADTYAVPLDMVGFAALQVLSLACQRKLNVRLRQDWVEPCVLWTLMVVPSGQKKSPLYKELMRPVKAWTISEAERHQQRQKELKSAIRLEQGRGKEADRSHTQALQEELANLPARKRVTMQDVTPSKLIRELGKQEGIRSLCIADPDRNRLADFAGGRYSDGNEMSILHNAYDGSPIEYDRVGSDGQDPSVYIAEARVGLFCMTHPSAWDQVIDPKKGYGDGAIGRLIVYLLPEVTEVTEADATREAPPLDPELRDAWDALITALLTDLDPNTSTADEDTMDFSEAPAGPIEIDLRGALFLREVHRRSELARNSSDPLNTILKWVSKWEAKSARAGGILIHAAHVLGDQPPTNNALHRLANCLLLHAAQALGTTAAAPSACTELQEADKLGKKLLKSAQETGRWITTVRDVRRANNLTADKAKRLLQVLDGNGYVTLIELDRNRVEVRITRPKLTLVAAE